MLHNVLTKFFQALKGAVPEYIEPLRKAIRTYKGETRESYIKQVHKLMTPHIKHISEYDVAMVSDDYIRGPLYLLPDVDIKELFATIDATDMDSEEKNKTQRKVFSHFQNIYVANETALAQVTNFNKAIDKQRDFLLNMLENMQLDDTLKERVEQLKAEEEAEGGEGGSGGGLSGILNAAMGAGGGEMTALLGMLNGIGEGSIGGTELNAIIGMLTGGGGAEGGDFTKLLGSITGADGEFNPEKISEMMSVPSGNFMLSLAKEIAEELDIAGGANPAASLMSLFTGGGEKFQNLVSSIGSKIQKKVDAGEIDQDRLMNDAKLMKSRFEGMFGNIPGLKDLMNGKAVIDQFKTAYASLSEDKKAEYVHISVLLNKPMSDWTDEEKESLTSFIEQTGAGAA
jgi:hypothetical protein